jgi:hypothetical protein
MGFFSNLIKKTGKFIASIFRDVEKPVKETEKTVTETVKVFEDTGLKAFRGFQKFIEAPIEKIEEIEEPKEVEEKIWIRKIVKLTAYSKGRKDDLFSGTWALWDERVYETLRDKIIKKYNRTHGIDGFSIDKDSSFGLDEQGESTTDPPFKFPNTEEWID